MPSGASQQSGKPTAIVTSQSVTETRKSFSSKSSPTATSPQSTYSNASSLAERNFFGAIVQQVRERSRSRSRSRTPKPTSPTVTASFSPQAPLSPTSPMSPRPYGYRQASESSVASSGSSHSAKRVSTSGSETSDWDRMAYGRHSNDVSITL